MRLLFFFVVAVLLLPFVYADFDVVDRDVFDNSSIASFNATLSYAPSPSSPTLTSAWWDDFESYEANYYLERNTYIPQPQNIVGYWYFDGCQWNDKTGRYNGSSDSSATCATGLRGNNSYAFNGLDSSGNRINTSYNFVNLSVLSSSVTIAAIVKPNENSDTSNRQIAGQLIAAGAGSDMWGMYQQGTAYYMRIDNGTAQAVPHTGGSSISAGRTDYVIGTYNGTTTCIQLNSNADSCSSAATGNINNRSYSFAIGGRPKELTSITFNGTIDEVILWNVSLSSTEKSQWRNATNYTYRPQSGGPAYNVSSGIVSVGNYGAGTVGNRGLMCGLGGGVCQVTKSITFAATPTLSYDVPYGTANVTYSSGTLYINISDGGAIDNLRAFVNNTNASVDSTLYCPALRRDSSDALLACNIYENNTLRSNLTEGLVAYYPFDEGWTFTNGTISDNNHSVSFDASSVNNLASMKIRTINSTTVRAIYKHSSSTPAQVQILDSGGGVLGTATFSGNKATFSNPINLNANSNYTISFDVNWPTNFNINYKIGASSSTTVGNIIWNPDNNTNGYMIATGLEIIDTRNSTTYDATGTNNGTLTGTTSAAGIVGTGSRFFDGTSYATANFLNLSDGYAFSFWVVVNNTATGVHLWDGAASGSNANTAFLVYSSGGNMNFRHGNGSTFGTVNTAVSTGIPTHFFGIKNLTHVSLYKNCVLASSNTGVYPIYGGGGVFKIGAEGGNGNKAVAYLDDLRVYNRTNFSTDDICALYEFGFPGSRVNSTAQGFSNVTDVRLDSVRVNTTLTQATAVVSSYPIRSALSLFYSTTDGTLETGLSSTFPVLWDSILIQAANYYNSTYTSVNTSTDLSATQYQSIVGFTATEVISGASVNPFSIYLNTSVGVLNDTFDSTLAVTGKMGEMIRVGTAPLSVLSITKASSSTATWAYVQDSTGGTNLGIATFTGDKATFATPVELSPSTQYRIVVDNSGGLSYDSRRSGVSVSYPYTTQYFNFTTGINNGAENSGQVLDIVSIETTVKTNTSSDPSFYLKAGTYSYTWNKTGWYNTTGTITATALTTSEEEIEAYRHLINFTARNGNTGAAINSFSVSLTSTNYSYSANYSTTNGSLQIPWADDIVQVVVTSTGFVPTAYNVSIPSYSTSLTNSSATLYTENTIFFSFKDIDTGALIVQDLNFSLQGSSASYAYNTSNGTRLVDVMADTYRVTATTSGYTPNTIYVTTDDDLQNVTMYLDQSLTEIIFIIRDTLGNAVSNATATLSYNVNGTIVTFTQCTSDFSGYCVVNLDTDKDYFITVIADSYVTFADTVRPVASASPYVINLVIPGSDPYVSLYEDVRYSIDAEYDNATSSFLITFDVYSSGGSLQYYGMSTSYNGVNYSTNTTSIPGGATQFINVTGFDPAVQDSVNVTFWIKAAAYDEQTWNEILYASGYSGGDYALKTGLFNLMPQSVAGRAILGMLILCIVMGGLLALTGVVEVAVIAGIAVTGLFIVPSIALFPLTYGLLGIATAVLIMIGDNLANR